LGAGKDEAEGEGGVEGASERFSWMSNGNYPSPDFAYHGVHALIGYGAGLTAAFGFHPWTYGFLALLVFALVK
jgi:hypothetical protein